VRNSAKDSRLQLVIDRWNSLTDQQQRDILSIIGGQTK
jgi:hypothetical protein